MSRRPSSKLETDMFPFMSVLCSIIGVMMLFMLLIISTRVVATEQSEAIALGAPPPPTPPPVQKTPAGLSDGEYGRLKSRIEELTRLRDARRQELKEFRDQILEAEDVVSSKEDERLRRSGDDKKVVGVELDKPVPVDVIMSIGPKTNKTHIFVEVKAEGYVVHDGKTPGGQFHAEADLDRQNSALTQFLVGVSRRASREYLVFLLHPNGIPAYYKIRRYLILTFPHPDPLMERSGYSRIDIGLEPFSPGWLLMPQKTGQAAAK